MATYEDLEAAVAAIHQAHPNWQPPQLVQTALNMAGLSPIVPNSVFDSLRTSAPPGVFDANGQIANPRPGTPTPVLPRPDTTTLPPPMNIPGPATGQPVDKNLQTPKNDLDSLRATGHPCKSKSVPHDQIRTFIDGYNGIIGATGSGPTNSHWNASIDRAKTGLQKALAGLSSGIRGQFADALNLNLQRSFQVLDDMSSHAATMEQLFDAFFDDLSTTRSNYEQYLPLYNQAISHPDEPSSKETLNQLNDLVLGIMDVYRGPIDGIAASHPSVDSAVPEVGPPMSGPAGLGGGPPAGSGGGAPEVLPQGGLNTGRSPAPPAPTGVQSDGRQSTPTVPADGGAGQVPGDGAGQGGGAGGQGGDPAAKPSADATKAGGKDGTGLYTGPLGLGSKGHSAPPKSGGGGAGRGGGGGRGSVGTKPPPTVATPPKAGGSPAPVSRAGISGPGGQGAPGAPVAGHSGSTADKAHKASKALRLPKHGEEVAGEAEGVVPVIGDVPRRPAPADRKKT